MRRYDLNSSRSILLTPHEMRDQSVSIRYTINGLYSATARAALPFSFGLALTSQVAPRTARGP